MRRQATARRSPERRIGSPRASAKPMMVEVGQKLIPNPVRFTLKGTAFLIAYLAVIWPFTPLGWGDLALAMVYSVILVSIVVGLILAGKLGVMMLAGTPMMLLLWALQLVFLAPGKEDVATFFYLLRIPYWGLLAVLASCCFFAVQGWAKHFREVRRCVNLPPDRT
jgi:hypothetical protein